MASPSDKEYHVSYGIGGAGNMRKQSDRNTAVNELTRMATNASEKASAAASTTYNAFTGASGPQESVEDYQRRLSTTRSNSVFTSSPPKDDADTGMETRRKSSLFGGFKGAFGGRKGSTGGT